ncbi:MAG: hypothetical protein H7Y88_06605 [Phycisphaerales bacterium]|nr:hypothetical protein [Phycisphaerales bacterium]
MANRNLSPSELVTANELLAEIRKQLDQLSRGDETLLWALRRKVFKELTYDERGKPMKRRKLKGAKRKSQCGICPTCSEPLPEKYCVLDRIEAMKGYTPENTRLLCKKCDTRLQTEKGYK